jgi:hypothetical protein
MKVTQEMIRELWVKIEESVRRNNRATLGRWRARADVAAVVLD